MYYSYYWWWRIFFFCLLTVQEIISNWRNLTDASWRIVWSWWLMGMVLSVTAGRWRSSIIHRHHQESLRTHPAPCFRSRSRSRSQSPTISIVRRETSWKRTRLLWLVKNMRDRSHHYRDHHGHAAMPLEEVQGLLLPPSRTGESAEFICLIKMVWVIQWVKKIFVHPLFSVCKKRVCKYFFYPL